MLRYYSLYTATKRSGKLSMGVEILFITWIFNYIIYIDLNAALYFKLSR